MFSTASTMHMLNNAESGNKSVPTSHMMIDQNQQVQPTPTTDGAMLLENPSSRVNIFASWAEYLSSWRFLELTICFVPLVLGIVSEVAFTPHQRPIPYQYLDSTGDYIRNQVYNEVFKGETVSSLALSMAMGWSPLILQLLLAWYTRSNFNSKVYRWDILHRTMCVYMTGIGTTTLVTNVLKLYVGYLRPIFYDQCQPDDNYEQCQNEDSRQLHLSFPSGHASLSICGMLLFSHYLEQSFGAYRNCYPSLEIAVEEAASQRVEGGVTGGVSSHGTTISTTRLMVPPEWRDQIPTIHNFRLQRIVSLLCYSPMLVALFVASSRVVDNKHFPADVVGGSILGGSIAHLVFSIWFPSWKIQLRR